MLENVPAVRQQEVRHLVRIEAKKPQLLLHDLLVEQLQLSDLTSFEEAPLDVSEGKSAAGWRAGQILECGANPSFGEVLADGLEDE